MSTATAKVDPKAHAKPEPPHIKATFAGQFYKATGGGKGKEYHPYQKTVRIPLSAVTYEKLTPIAYFHKYNKAKLLQQLGGLDLRLCELVEVEGTLPKLPFEHQLLWTPDYNALREIAESIGPKKYISVDLATNERSSHVTELDPNLYPSPVLLRQAIRTILEEPEAFDREQKRLQEADKAAPKTMEAEIAALGDD